MTWFEKLTGFRETLAIEVRKNIEVAGEQMTSSVNGRVMSCGRLETPSLGELRERLGLWQMSNGYALATLSGLKEISKRLRASNKNELYDLRELLRIGIQWNTQVTLKDSNHLVSQAYCSALPVAYSNHSSDLCEDFAR